jgi:excisionase family DNA binding protein
MKDTPPIRSPYLRPSEAAEYARVGLTTIKRWMQKKAIKRYKVNGIILVKSGDIDALIEKGLQ